MVDRNSTEFKINLMNKITISDLNNEIIMGIYDGLSLNDNLHPIYFDCNNLDVGSLS